MLRWIAVLSTLVLSGCVTTREVVYRDRYYPESSQARYYDEGGSERYYSRDGSYYSPSYAGSGDYYYGSDYYAPASYLDYPAYYSLFWSLNRSWYDPYYYPNYYYGVTYFPRNYLSVSFGGGGYGWPRYSYWAYSPYRYSWADNYYDWSPWHRYHGGGRGHHDRPRYGSARNEAERLSRISDSNRAYGRGDYAYGARSRGMSDDVRRTPYGTYGTTRGNTRDADYGSRTAPRQDPGTRGFGVPYDDGVRRTARGASYGGGNRELPATRGFGVPVDDGGTRGEVRRREANTGSGREINRVGGGRAFGDEPAYARPGAAARGYDEGTALPRGYQRGGNVRSRPSYDAAPVARGFSRPAPAARGYDRGADGGGYSAPPRERYSAPVQNYAPAPSANYSAPSRGYDAGQRSAPSPSYSAPEPRFESRSEPMRESRSESRSDSGGRGDVRRVGSRRDED